MDLSEQNRVIDAAQGVAGHEITLPLNCLLRDPLNVRKKAPGRSVEELAALIASQGLLQNLVVRAEVAGKKARKPTGRYAVVAGGRRLEALNLLFTRGAVTADFPVRCLEVSQDDALSVSLAENCGREPLHGADLFDAFCAMVEQGRTVEQIADAWGLSVLTVQRRLKLARVSPRLMALYREDGIELEQLMALTLTDDHALQEAVWDNAPAWERSAHALRRKLTECDVPATHALAVFVGIAPYEAAGGTVRRDLFAEGDGEGVFLTEPALLERLAREALEREADAVRAEGWGWVETRLRFDYAERRDFEPCRTTEREPDEQEQARLDALQERIEDLEHQYDDLGPDEDGEALIEQQEAAEREREAILTGLRQIDAQDKAVAGAVVHVDARGAFAVVRGLVRPGDRKHAAPHGAAGSTRTGASSTGKAAAAGAKPQYAERLLRQLTAHRTAALRATLAGNPRVALRVLAGQLAQQVGLLLQCGGDHPVEIRASTADVRKEGSDLPACPAQQALDAHHGRWRQRLPEDRGELLRWLLALDDAEVLDLLAVCTASAINAVQGREAPQPVADAIAAAVGLDMAEWWAPTAESFLDAVPKARVIEAVREAAGAEAARGLEGLKKEALVATAQQRLQGTRWLPEPLRARG